MELTNMNKTINIILSFMATGILIFACGQKNGDADKAIFEVSPTSIVLDPQGGQEFITITSSEDWLLRADAKWVKTVTASGKGSKEPVKATITYDANTDNVNRTTTLTVKTLKGQIVEIIASQAKLDGPIAERGISSAGDLLAFATAVNEGGNLTPFMVNGVVVLLNDIDASSISSWKPAGTATHPFTGSFDGKGYAINNINWTIDTSEYPNSGIIGYAKNATITNLIVGSSGDSMLLTGDASSVNAGAIVGYSDGGEVSNCTNYTSIEYTGTKSGETICIAGICGRYVTSTGAGILSCINRGNILSSVVSRVAGFVAHSEGIVQNCTNYGAILAEKSGEVGPAWACSYHKNYDAFKKNVGRGYVGSYATYKANPELADSDAYRNAVYAPSSEAYDMSEVTVDNTKESYYNWTEVKSMQVSGGVKYVHYDCDNVPRKVHILEIDMTNPAVEVTTAYANDCVPNPNGNKNSNNGFNIRETLSQLCERKRSEGQNVVAGINTGFFNSNDGISRGFHIEEGQPVYINNPAVVNALVNHVWAFTVFTDGKASCGKKKFTGKLKINENEYQWNSLNDTILRNTSVAYQINLYNSRYKKHPHPSRTNLVNKLAKNALYIIAEYDSNPMTVNGGYASAKVVSINDGRTTSLSEAPYITSKNQIGIALSGGVAETIRNSVSIGSKIEFRADMTIEGETTRPIYTQNSTMYHIMKNGADNLASVGSSSSLHTTQDPMTFPVISEDGKKVWLVEIDGRQGWYSTGVTGYEMYRIAKKLGGYNMTRFDGGGSSVMWVYDSAKAKGSVVNSVSDSKGERSCLNYLLIKSK